MAVALTVPDVWRASNTTPGQIEEALLAMMHERHNHGMVQAPARVLNLVVVADRARKGEVSERLERIGPGNPARTILVSVEPGKTDLDASATLVHGEPGPLGGETVFREQIEIDCGSSELVHLETVVRPVLASEVPAVVWSPHGHPEAIDALTAVATTVLLDSHDFEDWAIALGRLQQIQAEAHVCDLAWLRSTPWRERLAGMFDPPIWRRQLDSISRVELRVHSGSTMAALLYVGWLAARLEWTPHVLQPARSGGHCGYATGPAGQIEIEFVVDSSMPVPGLAGLTVETTEGLRLELNRDAGGLGAMRELADGTRHDWTMLGASRGEDGILAHGVANAMLPDDLFAPALSAACAFGGKASVAKSQSARGEQ